MLINKRLFGMENEQEIYEYTLKNDNGIEISCLNYGCTITKIITPDQQGNYENIVVGFSDVEAYKNNSMFAGAVIGRIAGRIKAAAFQLEGKNYTLERNNGANHLHGGPNGFHNTIWDVETIDHEHEVTLQFSSISKDGDGGYPGTLTTIITYTLTDSNELVITYQGQTDQSTLFDPTQHTYFNLSGNMKRDITQHTLKMASSKFLELTDELLPTGRMLTVQDSVFDFRAGRTIIDGIQSEDSQNVLAGHGYDHPFVLDYNNNREIVLSDQESGRSVQIETDAVGVVLYTGNCIPDHLKCAGGTTRPYLGLCLETQGLPDSIHHTQFPSCILKSGETVSTVTKYSFGQC